MPVLRALYRSVVVLVALCLFFLFQPLLSQSVYSQQKKLATEIRWMHPDFAPPFILKGENTGQGYAQLNEAMIKDRLPQYQHSIKTGNWLRLIKLLKHGDNVCFSYAVHNTWGVHSAPTSTFFLHNVITSKKHAPLFNPDELPLTQLSVSLEALRNNPNIKLGMQSGRENAYHALNPIIKAFKGQPNYYERAGTNLAEGMVLMIMRDRIHYYVDYHNYAIYAAKQLGVEDQIVSIPIEENNALFGVASISCSNSPSGRQFIRDINQVVLAIREKPEFYERYEKPTAYPGANLEWMRRMFREHVLPVTSGKEIPISDY